MKVQKKIFIFIGPPGAGKGSLAQLCTKFNGWEQLSTGNLFRKHIAEKTEIGQKIDFAIKSGILISDDLVTQMVEKWLTGNVDKVSAIILDGFPRTVMQAEGLNELIKTKFEFLGLCIVRLIASDVTVMNRIFFRCVCVNQNCQAVYSFAEDSMFAPKLEGKCNYCEEELVRRPDDEKESVFRRLSIYHQHEKVLLDFYRNAGHDILEFNVERPLLNVFHEFSQYIDVEVV